MEKPIKQKYFVKHWVSALVVAVLVCLIGVVGLNSLSIEQYPNIAPPQVVISASYTGADVASIMKSVIIPIEEQVNGVEDMMYISSSAFSNGSAEISVYFKQGTDADKATVNVQNRVSQAEGILPAAVTQQGVTVRKSVNSILQIQSLESTDDRFDQKFIINYLDINVIPRISRITGVGSIKLLGDTYGVRIWIKPDVMASYGVTREEIINAINEQHMVSPVGSIESTVNKMDIEFKGQLSEMSEFGEIILRATTWPTWSLEPRRTPSVRRWTDIPEQCSSSSRHRVPTLQKSTRKSTRRSRKSQSRCLLDWSSSRWRPPMTSFTPPSTMWSKPLSSPSSSLSSSCICSYRISRRR